MPVRHNDRDLRSNTRDRRARREWLLRTFGNGRVVPCTWCGKRMRTRFEVDRFPVCGHAGGRYTRDNIVPACGPCNRRRCIDGRCQTVCPNVKKGCPNHQRTPF